MRARFRTSIHSSIALTVALSLSASASAQTTGTPPADQAEAVKQQKAEEALKPNEVGVDSTSAAVSAGGQYATGNSKLVAGTATAKFAMRRGADAFGVSLVGNYARGFIAPPAITVPVITNNMVTGKTVVTSPGAWETTTENLQAKVRYDRYFTRDLSGFIQVTGLHDAFQAIVFRLNADPGIKYLFVNRETTKFWGEIGYDFQFDYNQTFNGGFEQAGAASPGYPGQPGAPAAFGTSVNDAVFGVPFWISTTDTINSGRLFAGVQHGFSKEVTLTAGLEYLQGFAGSNGTPPPLPKQFKPLSMMAGAAIVPGVTVEPAPISLNASRLNFDALFAAHLFGGFSLGLGVTLKYNSQPLPGKVPLDSTGTVSLIYAFQSKKDEAPPAPTCPCPAVVVPAAPGAPGAAPPAPPPAPLPGGPPGPPPSGSPAPPPSAPPAPPNAPAAPPAPPAPPAGAAAPAPPPVAPPAPPPAPRP